MKTDATKGLRIDWLAFLEGAVMLGYEPPPEHSGEPGEASATAPVRERTNTDKVGGKMSRRSAAAT